MNIQSTVLGPIFILLVIEIGPLLDTPYTLKYFKLGFHPVYFTYGIDYVLLWGTLLCIRLGIRIAFHHKFCGKRELISKVFIISSKVWLLISVILLD